MDRPSASSSEVEWIDPLQGSAWDEAVLRYPAASPFHSSAWARVLAKTYGHRPYYFRFRSATGGTALVPLMEVNSRLTGRRGVCLPFSDFCGPLCEGAVEQREILARLATLARDRGWKRVEIRDGGLADPEGRDDTEPCYHGHDLDLRPGLDQIEAGFSPSVRRAIRKSMRSGVTTHVSHSWDAMQTFVRHHALTRRRHGIPPQPMAFFRHIHRELLQSGRGFVVIAEHASCPVASAVFLQFGCVGVFKFGASDPAALSLRPNNLVMSRGIAELADRGMHALHFGRSDTGQDGLRRFKRSWGAHETPLTYLRFEPKTCRWVQPLRRAGNTPVSLFRLLPPVAGRWAGRLLYRHLD